MERLPPAPRWIKCTFQLPYCKTMNGIAKGLLYRATKIRQEANIVTKVISIIRQQHARTLDVWWWQGYYGRVIRIAQIFMQLVWHFGTKSFPMCAFKQWSIYSHIWYSHWPQWEPCWLLGLCLYLWDHLALRNLIDNQLLQHYCCSGPPLVMASQITVCSIVCSSKQKAISMVQIIAHLGESTSDRRNVECLPISW